MRDAIAGTMAVLGTLLVLSGATVIVLRALSSPSGHTDEPTGEIGESRPGTPNRFVRAARKLSAADRLIGWGVVLLVLGAVAAGAISFSVAADAGTR